MNDIKQMLNTPEFKRWLVQYESARSHWWMGWIGYPWAQKLVSKWIARRITRKLAALKRYYAWQAELQRMGILMPDGTYNANVTISSKDLELIRKRQNEYFTRFAQ